MLPNRPTVTGTPEVSAVLRRSPDDFRVFEELGFEPSGEGEHAFLQLQKCEMNTLDLLDDIAALSGIGKPDIGVSGMKDRNALTQQWFSVRMAGRPEPNWTDLEKSGAVKVLRVERHTRKLKRGVHRANRFELRLRDLSGDMTDLHARLERIKIQGFPNYFGEQRFGRAGSTLVQAQRWINSGGKRITRVKRSLYLSALRAFLFNTLLADRVAQDSWNTVLDGDVCMLQGTRSLFSCDTADEETRERAERGDIHPTLPLWGKPDVLTSQEKVAELLHQFDEHSRTALFLERMGLDMSYRPARVLLDDFCWQFCEDDSLQLEFSLRTGSYATSVLAELVQYTDINRNGG
jgi:tRNA pseudouridine13 synthase